MAWPSTAQIHESFKATRQEVVSSAQLTAQALASAHQVRAALEAQKPQWRINLQQVPTPLLHCAASFIQTSVPALVMRFLEASRNAPTMSSWTQHEQLWQTQA